MLFVTLCCLIPTLKTKKFAPSLTRDINPHSSHLNSVKMTIACNSAHIQTETLNFTFTRQAIIVHFDAKRLSPPWQTRR